MPKIFQLVLAALLVQLPALAFASATPQQSGLYGPIAPGATFDYVELAKLGKYTVVDGPFGDKTITFEQLDAGNEYQWEGRKPIKIELVFFNLRLWAETLVYPSGDKLADALAADSGYPALRAYDCWRNQSTRHGYALIGNRLTITAVALSVESSRRKFTREPKGQECRIRP